MPVGLPIGAFLAATLVLIPLGGHWRARNMPTLSMIFWFFLVNVAHGVNAIAWSHNVNLKLLVWCDIVIRLDIGANLALPAACFCLCMHLERVASVRNVSTSHSEKRKRMIIDIILCFILPSIYVAMFYIVQGHRFDIFEDFGCQSEDYVSIPEFFFVWFLPILLGLGTCVLAGLAFLHFFRRRANFARHLAASSSLTPGRYFRLMAMSLVLIFWSLLVIALNLAFNYAHGLRPWTNWNDVHSNWSRVDRFPAILIPPATLKWTYFLWWTTPISTYTFVAFFAFGQETMKDVSTCANWVRQRVLHRKSKPAGAKALDSLPPSSPSDSLPVYSAKAAPHHIVINVNDFKKNDFPLTPTESIFSHSTLTSLSTLPSSPSSPTTDRTFTDSVLSYYNRHTQSFEPSDRIGSEPDVPTSVSAPHSVSRPLTSLTADFDLEIGTAHCDPSTLTLSPLSSSSTFTFLPSVSPVRVTEPPLARLDGEVH